MKTIKQILAETKTENFLSGIMEEVVGLYEGSGQQLDIGIQILEKYMDLLPSDVANMIAEELHDIYLAEEDEEEDEEDSEDDGEDEEVNEEEDGEDEEECEDEECDESLTEAFNKTAKLKLAKMRAKVKGTKKRVSVEDGKFAGFHAVDLEKSRVGKRVGKKNLKKAHKGMALRKAAKTKKKLGEID